MAIKVNDYSYTPRGHFEPVTVSGSYHNITSVSWIKKPNRRISNIITTTVYKNSASYAAGEKPFQQIAHGVNFTEISSSISSSINYEYSSSMDSDTFQVHTDTIIGSSSVDHTINTTIDIPSGKQWVDNITSDSNVSFLSASYEVLKSQAPRYSGSVHVVDVL